MGETTVVGRPVVPKNTRAAVSKPVPLTVSTNEAESACTVAGFSEVAVGGAGALIVKDRGGVVVLPSTTYTAAVPAEATSLFVIAAWRLVDDVKVVVLALPFQ